MDKEKVFYSYLPKLKDGNINEIEYWYYWKKIKDIVYKFQSFDKGKTWKRIKTPYKELPYVILNAH